MNLRAYIVALHAAALLILLAVLPAGSGSISLMGAGKTGASAPAKSCVATVPLLPSNGNATNTRTFSMTGTTPVAGQTVAVALFAQGGTVPGASDIVFDPSGVALTLTRNNFDTIGGSGEVAIYSAIVTGSPVASTIQVSNTGAFNEVGVSTLVCSNLVTGYVDSCKGVGGGSQLCTLPAPGVVAGDTVLSITYSSSGNSSYANSTDSGSATVANIDTVGPFSTSAYWLSAPTTRATFVTDSTNATVPAIISAIFR